jgi:hypothetical protein
VFAHWRVFVFHAPIDCELDVYSWFNHQKNALPVIPAGVYPSAGWGWDGGVSVLIGIHATAKK